MAQNNPITTRETLKQYALRALGKPVIEINVEDDQVEDRIDEALQYFAQYHYDGTERMYLKYQITADDITRARSDETLSTVTDTADSTVSATFKEGKNYIPMPSNVMSVIKLFPFTDVFDDIFLKKYLIQLVKRQWGSNLIKFQGVAMLGGVQMNGEQIYTQAQEEINKLEEQIQLAYELPPHYMVG